MLKACIFDLDGVIVDTAKYHYLSWRRMANELGFDFSEEQNELLKGVNRIKSLEIILEWGGKTLTEDEKMRWADIKNGWYMDYVRQMGPDEILPGSADFLNELRENGIKVGLGSASKNAQEILERVQLLSLFDVIIDGNRANKSKPDPMVFQLGASALNVLPSQAVVFEDAVKGVEAGQNGGFFVVGIGEPEVLHQADFVVPSLANINLRILKKEFASVSA